MLLGPADPPQRLRIQRLHELNHDGLVVSGLLQGLAELLDPEDVSHNLIHVAGIDRLAGSVAVRSLQLTHDIVDDQPLLIGETDHRDIFSPPTHSCHLPRNLRQTLHPCGGHRHRCHPRRGCWNPGRPCRCHHR